MAGVKQYERSDLLDRAMDLFHRQSFNSTTTAQLAAELGVNPKSMYAEFGSKQALFEAALDHYNATSLSGVLSAVEAEDAGADAIRSTFAGFATASEGWAQGRGCLLCNTAAERSALDPASGDHVDAYFGRLNAAFRNALSGAQREGEVRDSADLDELAAFFTMALVGIATLARGNANPEQIHAASRTTTGVLDTLRPKAK